MSEAAGSWDEARALDRRIVVVWTVQDALGYGLLGAAGPGHGHRSQAGRRGRARPPGLAAGLAAVGGAWPPGGGRGPRRHWRYQVAADALELRHGVVRQIHSYPLLPGPAHRRRPGPFEQVVGLSRLVLHTASAGTDATIPGIAAGDAEACRLILARAGHGDAV